MKALVLSGGGARGAYEAGVARALTRSQSFDLFCGTSIGAINAAFLAAGRADRLESLWCSVLPERAPALFPHLPRMRHMLADLSKLGHGSRWNDALAVIHALSDTRSLKLFGGRKSAGVVPGGVALAREIDEHIAFAEVGCMLVVAATNVTAGLPAALYSGACRAAALVSTHRAERAGTIEWRALETEKFSLAIVASAALPGLLAPVELEFEDTRAHYADGGLVQNSPIGLALDAGATDITVVFVDPVFGGQHTCPQRGVGGMACAMFVLWQQRALEYELRLIDATNALIRAGALPGRSEVQVRFVQPEAPLEIDVLGFEDAAAVARTFAQGVRDGERSMLA